MMHRPVPGRHPTPLAAPRGARRRVVVNAILAALALVAGALPRSSLAAAPLAPDRVDAWVRGAMTHSALPGVAIAIVQDGETVLVRGYGSAAPGRPMMPDTPMLLGSVSKSFTALAVMQLVERGALELDAPVTRYLPWFRVSEAGAADRILVRHLLGHASGLTDLTFQEASYLRDDQGLEALGRALAHARPNAEPGTRFQYLNAGYDLLGLLVETVSGESYPAYLRRHVFAPLGMTNTTAEPARVGDLARGHALAFGLSWPAHQWLPRYGTPSGYVVSTAADMARYARAMLSDGVLDGVRVLEPASAARLRRGSATFPFYGMGWFLASDAYGRRVYHGGANETFHADVVLYPDRGDGVVVLVNQDNLISAFSAYPRLLDGVVALALGGVPPAQDGTVRRYGLAAVALLVLVVALEGWAVLRAGRWARSARSWRVWRRVASLLVGALLAAVVIAAVALGVRAWMGRGFSLRALVMLPDVALLASLWLLGEIAVALARILALRRSRVRARVPVASPTAG